MGLRPMSQATSVDAPGAPGLLAQVDELAEEIARLKDLALAFERWHQDMIATMAQNQQLNNNGEELTDAARQLIMVSLNATIEAAHAGDTTRGFVIIAAEIKNLALRVQGLSRNIDSNLHKSHLMATATFQDIQAGGKMMMALLSGLELMIKHLRTEHG